MVAVPLGPVLVPLEVAPSSRAEAAFRGLPRLEHGVIGLLSGALLLLTQNDPPEARASGRVDCVVAGGFGTPGVRLGWGA